MTKITARLNEPERLELAEQINALPDGRRVVTLDFNPNEPVGRVLGAHETDQGTVVELEIVDPTLAAALADTAYFSYATVGDRLDGLSLIHKHPPATRGDGA